MLGVINDLQLELSVSLDHGNTSFDRVAVDKKLAEFKLRVVNCNGTISETANILKKKSGSVGETFHWLVFIFIFASAYVFSSDQ